VEFFYSQPKNSLKYKPLKDWWVNNETEVFRFNNKFYIKK